jgi:hypothetical protein
MPRFYAVNEMSPYALLGAADLLLRELQRRPEVDRADKTACVPLLVELNEMRRKYIPKPPSVPLGHQYAMLAGAPEAERDALLGRAG